MKIKLPEVARELEAEVVHRSRRYEAEVVEHVVASALMSEVLVVDHSRLLVVTSLASEQALHTAHVVGAVGVVIVGGKTLPAGMKALAHELDVTLLRTRWPEFETCVRLGRAMGAA